MVTTGLTAGLSWVQLFLPILPALIIIFRQKWQQPINGCLLGFCLLNSAHHLLLFSQHFSNHDADLINAIANLMEWLLLFYILKLETDSKWMRQLMYFFLVSFSSVALTIFFLAGTDLYAFPIILIEACTLILIAFFVLLQLVSDRQIIMFKTQDFWIAGSIFCNYGMLLFAEGIVRRDPNLALNIQNEKQLIVELANAVSFILISVAVTMNKTLRDT
jgi:hypothetical protein